MRGFKKRMERVWKQAERITVSSDDRMILFSDVHRGDGTYADQFMPNQQIYFTALRYYLKSGYTYIELGDGDELWENRNFATIREAHGDIFWLLREFYLRNRLIMLYGNHDMAKKSARYWDRTCSHYHCEVDLCKKELFPDLQVKEGIVLTYKDSGRDILLIHGHQGDFMNDTGWRIGRFLVRYLWRPFNSVGLIEPTSAAKNHHKKGKIEKRMIHWADKNNTMLIAGHTHRSMFPCPKESLYFNTGSCVHPRCITGIEIAFGEITLVKWCYTVTGDNVVKVGREVLEGPFSLCNYM